MFVCFPDEHQRVYAASSDQVISMAILHGIEASSEEARAYLKHAAAMRRAAGEDAETDADEEIGSDAAISQDRIAALGAVEQFVLTLTENGYGKRSSSYEYRVSGRGGKGIIAIVVNDRNGPVVASFPVEDSDQIMLVTNAGQLIRTPVHDIRAAGRNTQGVTVFKTRDEEEVVSVGRIEDIGEGDDDDSVNVRTED